MNQKQLQAIIALRATSENPDLMESRMAAVREYNSCIEYINGECDECNGCEVLEVLDNPEDYI